MLNKKKFFNFFYLENKVMRILFFLFFLINILDIVTSYFILGGEANPIYLFLGNIWVLYILKIGIVFGLFFIIKNNKYGSNFGLFMLIAFVLYGLLIFGLGVYSNIQGIINPVILEESTKIPNDIKIKAYTNFVVLLYYIPVGITLICFKLYEWAFKYTKLPNIKRDEIK